MKNLKSPFNSYIRNSQNDSDVAQTVIILQLYKKSNQFYHFGKRRRAEVLRESRLPRYA